MPAIAKKHSILRVAAATILLSTNATVGAEVLADFSNPLTRAQFQPADYNHICPLAVYNEDYRRVQDAKISDATAGKSESLQTKPTWPMEASNG